MKGFDLQKWWALDPAAETASEDNPLTPLTDAQRRPGGPLLALAFGWGFLITGLLAGGALGSGVTLWGDLIWYSLLGSAINFAIGALVGYMAWRTGCNSTLLFRAVYGELGAFVPVLFVALLTIGWQGIVVGAFAQIWTQAPGTALYYGVAIFAGVLYTGTTLFGVKGIERVGIPAMLGLVAVGLYAAWVNIAQSGGIAAVETLSASKVAEAPISGMEAINIVVGAWIVGAVVMAEYVRFARTFWVAMGIPFVVLVVDQLFLHLVGALGAVGSGTPDFTAYLGTLSGFAYLWIGRYDAGAVDNRRYKSLFAQRANGESFPAPKTRDNRNLWRAGNTAGVGHLSNVPWMDRPAGDGGPSDRRASARRLLSDSRPARDIRQPQPP